MLNLLKSRTFLVGQGLVALIVLVLVLGRVFHLSTTIQMIAIIAILVVGLVLLLIGFVRANRSASAIQQSMRSQGEQQRMGVRPDKQGEIEQLERDLEEAIERLKRSKLGGGRRSKAALYAMPWYMIIGPPAAGKTTAIANSGMNFPLGTDAIHGVGGTRNCDWFFSDSAIFLDTAGRYMTEQEDQEEWHAFLQTLRDNRRRQPINGVIVAINADALVDASADQIEWHALTIRRRIDDLVSRLQVTFPVYLVFTKCDLLQGFVQFFGYLNRNEREQIWGFTLPRDWQQESDIRERFDEEFGRLSQSLVNWRNAGLGRSMKREQRQAVYVFPLEFASTKENLSQFASLLFRPNPYRDTPLLRGVYFTSGTQEGVPIDRVIRSIARRFGLAPAEHGEAEPVTEAKAYFIRDLFEKIIISDRYLVSRTSRFQKRQTILKATTGAVAGVVLLLFLLGAVQAVVRSQLRLSEVVDGSTAAATVDASGSLGSSDIDRLASLGAVVAKIDRPSNFTWGLDRGGELYQPTLELLLEKVRTYVDVRLFGHLENRMREALSRPVLDEFGKEGLYDDFKAYLLLTDSTGQLSNEPNAVFLKRQLASLVDSIAARGTSPDPRLYELTESFVDGLRDGNVEGLVANRRLVAQAQPALSEPISPERLYARLRREGEESVGVITLSEISGRNSHLFDGDPTISQLFTQSVWSTFVEDRIDEVSADKTRDEWVPGTVAQRDVSENEVAARIRTLYLEEYAAAWERLLAGVRLVRFQNTRDAASKLEILSDGEESPILWLLARISDETTFDRSVAEAAAANLGAPDTRVFNLVERHFQPLHDLNVKGAANGTADPSLLRALDQLKRIGDALESMEGDETKLADYAANVFESGGGEVGAAIGEIGSSLSRLGPSIRDNLFERPVFLSWDVMLATVQEYLDDQWQEQVFTVFRETLNGRYPIAEGDDAPIDDFEIFFRGSNGILTNYYEEVLSPFVQPNRLVPRTWPQNRGVTISAAASNVFERAETIREVLFEGDRLRYTFEIQPEHPVSSQPVSSYDLDIHGHSLRYEMGTPFASEIAWPGPPGATLRVSARGSDLQPLRFDGHWAMFRLLRAADIVRLSTTSYELRWDMGGSVTAVYKVTTRSAGGPFADGGGFFRIAVPSSLGG